MLKARDLMTEDVLTISSEATVAQAIALMQAEKVRSLIVVCPKMPEPYGILTERDILYRVVAPDLDPALIIVGDIMRQPCISIQPDHSIQEVAQLFSYSGIQRAPVIESETLLGVISATDIVMKLDLGNQKPADRLSRQIQEALRHSRITSSQDEQMEKETAIAWNIVEELEQ